MITIATLRAAGLSDTEILRVVEIEQNEVRAARREQNRINQRNHRARQHVTADAADCVSPSLLTSIERPSLEKEERLEIVALGGSFATFWQQYPHKVGKRAAMKAFTAARKRATFEIITAGLIRYASKTDDRPWCNPATWLNQDRWDDQPGPTQEGNGKAKPKQQASVLDFASGFDARTRMQLAERAEIERQRKRP